jgi:ArsR family transcriptional regulator
MTTHPEHLATACRFRADTLKALAHPSRLLMLETLAEGERCVCDLRELVGLDLSTVSKHLSLLREAGLVIDERRGNRVYYRLCCPAAADLLAALAPPLDDLARRRARDLVAAGSAAAPVTTPARGLAR